MLDIEELKQYSRVEKERKRIELKIERKKEELDCVELREIEFVTNARDDKKEISKKVKTTFSINKDVKEKQVEELKAMINDLEETRLELMRLERRTEKALNTIEDSIVREIIRMRYIEGQKWINIGYKTCMSESSCRMIVERYFKKCAFCAEK